MFLEVGWRIRDAWRIMNNFLVKTIDAFHILYNIRVDILWWLWFALCRWTIVSVSWNMRNARLCGTKVKIMIFVSSNSQLEHIINAIFNRLLSAGSSNNEPLWIFFTSSNVPHFIYFLYQKFSYQIGNKHFCIYIYIYCLCFD